MEDAEEVPNQEEPPMAIASPTRYDPALECAREYARGCARECAASLVRDRPAVDAPTRAEPNESAVDGWTRGRRDASATEAPAREGPAAGANATPLDADRRLVARLRAQAPLRRTLARLLGRLSATQGWDPLGYARAADYARERLGMAPRQLRELVRVDAALPALPAVERAFLAGEISFTKTRLLCTVAAPEDEARWLAHARRVTARALERDVRAVQREAAGLAEAFRADGAWQGHGGGGDDGGDGGRVGGEGNGDDDDSDGRHGDGSDDGGGQGATATAGTGPHDPSRNETLEVRCTPEVQSRWWRVRQVAARAAGERLEPWQCAEAAVGEALSALPTGALPDDDGDGRAPDAHDDPAVASLAEALEAAADTQAEAGRQMRATTPTSDPASDPGESAAPDDRQTRADATLPPAPGPALPPALASLVEGIDEADAFELDVRIGRARRLEQRAWAEIGRLLGEVVRDGLHRLRGYRSVEAYARERLGIAPSKARALLRLERACGVCPALRRAYRERRVSWVKAQELARVLLLEASHPWRARWVGWAPQVTFRRLEEDVECALVLHATDPQGFARTGGLPAAEPGAPARWREAVGRPEGDDGAGRQTRANPTAGASYVERRRSEDARFFFVAPREVARQIRTVIAAVRLQLEERAGRPATEGEAMDAILVHALEAWGRLDPELRRAHRVFERDGWRCAVPGCTSYRNLHDHHIRFRSAGGSDALENRVTLCAFHHLRGIHAGTIRCTGQAPDGLVFELGLRPGAVPLLRYASGDRVLPAPAPA